MSEIKGLKSYQALLDAYRKEVIALEAEFAAIAPESGAVPYRVINSRMPTPKIYLIGPNGNYYYHDLKEKLIPLIIVHAADVEMMTESEKSELQTTKPKSKYQEYLDELLVEFIPFKKYCENTIGDQAYHIANLRLPIPPKRKNATRQKQEYNNKMQDYQNSREKYERNIQECEGYLGTFNDLLR